MQADTLPFFLCRWDAQWQTQMFEKGYGLETRTGGWRFNRVREDKKDVDEESTVLALVKNLETLVTKEQVCHLDAFSAWLMEISCNSNQNRPLTAPCHFGFVFLFPSWKRVSIIFGNNGKQERQERLPMDRMLIHQPQVNALQCVLFLSPTTPQGKQTFD